MCLDTVTKRFNKPDKKVRKGWKLFKQYEGGGRLFFPIYANNDSEEALTGKFIKNDSTGDINCGSTKETYPRGFHIFKNRKGAVRMAEWVSRKISIILPVEYSVILPVEYKEALVEGLQDGDKVVVANQIRIPRNYKKYKRKSF